MKNKGNLLATLFITLLLTSIIPATVVNAASPSLSASADKASAANGDYVTINITLNNNPSLSTLGMSLSYDGSILQYDSTSWSGSFSGNDMKMASDTGSEVNLSVVCEESYLANGTVATVRFQAIANTDSIPITLSLRDMADAELSAVSNCSVAAKVKTPAQPSQKPANKEEITPPETNEPAANESTSSKKHTSQQDSNAAKSAPTQNVSSAQQQTGLKTQQVTVSTQTNQSQRTTSQNVQSASSSSTKSVQADRNYKTGAGIGNDMFLMIAAVCGITVLLILMKKTKKEEV